MEHLAIVSAPAPARRGALTPVRPGPDPPLKPPACVVVTALAAVRRLRAEWAALQARCARNELAQSPEWLLAWWRVYGGLHGRRLRLCLFHDAGRLIGIAPLLYRRHWYRGTLPFRRLELLASGEPPEHGIYSNHVGILAEQGAEGRVAAALVRALVEGAFGPWDEVVLPMMSGDMPLPGLLADAFRAAGLDADLTETARAPYLPLPATWEAYLHGLSGNGRRNVLRSMKAFDAWAGGTTRLESATDAAGLAKGQQVLIQLHHARWAADGRPGVFRSPYYLQFHDTVMRSLLERGALELHWLCARGEPVAVLYGMAWGSKVYAYQTGRRTDLPARLRPGAVLLVLAIRRAIEAGRREFDLLTDEAPYKFQLARQARPLVRLRAARPCFVEHARRITEGAVTCVRQVRGMLRHIP